MAVRFLTTLLTISMVLGTGRALSCYECKAEALFMNGMVASGEETGLDSDGNCEQATCESGMDACVTGTYKISATAKQGDSDWMSMENSMIYSKGCGQQATTSCEALETALIAAAAASDDGSEVKDIEVSPCEFETCDTDNCNTKTPTEINSAYSEPISCYTCSAVEMGEVAAQECTDDNKKECPFGVTQCVYGNLEVTAEVEGVSTTQQVEYLKDCGGSMFSNCYMLELILAEAGISADNLDCNIGTCSGDLCNTQTVEEVKAHESGSSAVQSAVILLTASILYFIA